MREYIYIYIYIYISLYIYINGQTPRLCRYTCARPCRDRWPQQKLSVARGAHIYTAAAAAAGAEIARRCRLADACRMRGAVSDFKTCRYTYEYKYRNKYK